MLAGIIDMKYVTTAVVAGRFKKKIEEGEEMDDNFSFLMVRL